MERLVSQSLAAFAVLFLSLVTVSALIPAPPVSTIATLPALA